MSDDTNNASSSGPAPLPRRKGRGVLCARCEHLNPSELETCEYCDTPLHMKCPACSVVNPRVLTQCTECRTPLHRSAASAASEAQRAEKTRRPAQVSGPGPGILCVECDHLNPDGLEKCEHCESELFIQCPNCSHRNNRAHEKCRTCRSPLSRSLKDRILGKNAGPEIRQIDPELLAKVTDGKGLVCAKCSHVNPTGIGRCESCQGHLYIVCRKCKHTNPRMLQRCAHCEHRLHRSSREGGGGGNTSKPLNLAVAGIALVAFVVAATILVKMSGLRIFK
jgi:hypothetical protein